MTSVDRRFAAQCEIRRTAVGKRECQLLDHGSGIGEMARGRPAEILDGRIDADACNIRRVPDAKAL